MEEKRYPIVIFEVKHEDGRIEYQHRYDVPHEEYDFLNHTFKIVFPIEYDKKGNQIQV